MDTPSYYNTGITPVEFMRSHFTNEEIAGFYRGNAIKYLARAYKKHESPIDDLKKAKVYIDYLLEHERNVQTDVFQDQQQQDEEVEEMYNVK
tara:strand:+ start:957 stop:1232 length:276 start_codon:yes stop_codon:yes gene_type:complete